MLETRGYLLDVKKVQHFDQVLYATVELEKHDLFDMVLHSWVRTYLLELLTERRGFASNHATITLTILLILRRINISLFFLVLGNFRELELDQPDVRKIELDFVFPLPT